MATEFVGIELQLRGYDGVMADLQKMDSMLNGLRRSKGKTQIAQGLAEAKKQIIGFRGELDKLQRELAKTEKGSDRFNEIGGDIETVKGKMREAQQAAREFQYALKNLTKASFMQNFNRISSITAHIGSAMQSAGNALTKFTSPFADFFKGAAMGAGYQALNKFTEGLQSGFERYDTMKKYPKMMKAFGYSSKASEKSIKRLDKSVRGLPTGLDEMVDMTQRFTATTGDLEKGTNLAIAANNAFLASMATDTQRYQGMMQLQDVIGGKDMNAREWNSLVSSMTPAVVKMGESLGYTSKNMGEFIQKVRDGKMSNEDFVKSLIKVGTKNGAVAKMAQQSKDTWQAFFANVGNAASRMTYGILTSLDEISQVATGKDVNAFLSENVISGINNMTESAKGWIKAHPEEITDFFKSLGSINWGSIAKGFAEGAINVADGIKALADAFGGKDLALLGKSLIYGNIIGKGLTIGGGLIKGTRGIFGGIGAGGIEVFKTIKALKEEGGIKGLLSGMWAGSKGADVAKTAGEVEKGAASMGKAASGLSKAFSGWGKVAGMVGGTALVGFGTFKAFKSMMKDLDEMISIGRNIDWDKGTAIMLGMGGFIAGFIKLSETVGPKLGLGALKGGGILAGLSLLFTGSFAVDMKLVRSGFKSLKNMTLDLEEATATLSRIKQIKNIGGIKSNIRQVITSFNQITDMLMGEKAERNNPVTGESRTGGLKKLSGSTTKTIDNLASSLKSMTSAVDSIKALGKIDLSGVDLTGIGDSLNAALSSIGDILINVPPIFQSGEAINRATRISSVMSNMKNAFTSVIAMTKQIPKITSAMGQMSNTGSLNSLSVQMEQLGGVLTSVYTSLQGIDNGSIMTANLESFVSGLSKVQEAIRRVNAIGKLKISAKGVSNISGIINKIKSAFNAEAISAVKTAINDFVTAVNEGLDSIDRINGDKVISISVKLKGGKVQGLETVVSKINNARSRINSAWSRIPNSLSKTIGVHISANVDASGATSAINRGGNAVRAAADKAINSHTGGYIRGKTQYRAKGGSIFKPRGTDTVPAMLTPGEFVQRKKAVDTFGYDFMRKVNSLDIRGAMQSLMAKAGSMASVGRHQVVNNTYNNNQKVIQTINTNSPAFAWKNASRFVGAF